MSTAERDPGLQPERTRLAWRRTTLSCTVASVLAGKQALQGGGGPATVIALSMSALAWLGFLRVAHRRVQSMGRPHPPALGARAALSAAACTVALAVFAVAMLF
ncbi:DUF202 domain-containing protein [Streptomyces sp. NPDC001515]